MNLTPIEHLERKYIRKMKRLNRESFPKQERIDFDKLVDLSNNPYFDFLAIKDDEMFIGFFLIAKNAEVVYLFFFSVTKEQQTQNTGNQLLALLMEYYPYQQVVLDLVEIEEGPSAIPREAKKDFYLRNGFYETGYDLQHEDLRYELLCNKDAFDKDRFMSLLQEITPLINELKNGTFSPSVIEKSSL